MPYFCSNFEHFQRISGSDTVRYLCVLPVVRVSSSDVYKECTDRFVFVYFYRVVHWRKDRTIVIDITDDNSNAGLLGKIKAKPRINNSKVTKYKPRGNYAKTG